MLNKENEGRYLTLRRSIIEKCFAKMNDMQRAAVLSTKGPLLILAGAGSGKTTVLINRIANMLMFGNGYESQTVPFYINEEHLKQLEEAANSSTTDFNAVAPLLWEDPPRPWEILAITFTNKAAGELRERLSKMLGEEQGSKIHASTFHSACIKILRNEITHLGYKSGFTIYDSDDSQKVIKEAIKALNLDDKQFAPRSVLSRIGTCKDMLETPAMTKKRAEEQNDFATKKIAQLYDEYQKRLFAANALDFDDIITLTVRLFDQHPQILAKYSGRYKYVMVDEYQDTNRSQYRLVSQLSSSCGNLCVVGDDDQSIYRFRGATIENILSFENQYENAKVIRLEQNYRSTQNILTAANNVISQNKGRKGKTLWTAAGEGEKLVLHTAYDERDEASAIADGIRKLHAQGRAYSDCAVLYRLNAQSQAVESALVNSGIPYTIVGGTKFFDRKEIKDIIAYLSVLHNPADTLRLSRIINVPKRNIGDATLRTVREIADVTGDGLFEVLLHAEDYAPLQRKAAPLMAFATMMQQLMEMLETLPLEEMISKIVTTSGYDVMLLAEGIQGQTRLENIEELKTTIKRYVEETQEPSLGGFLEEVALYTDLDSLDSHSDKVVLMTMHGAKGLEFPFVFLPGMEEGIFPSVRATINQEEIEEERRLAYVAITRAKEQLTMFCAKRRMLFGQTLYGKLSRFFEEIPKELIVQGGRRPSENKTAHASDGFMAKKAANTQSAMRSGISGSKAKSDSIPQNLHFAVGESVSHRIFGIGVISGVTPMGGDNMLEIKFDKVGTKKIMASYAKLEKI